MKWLAIPALTIFLVGCGSQPVKLRTETVEVVRPVLYCPAPDFEQLAKPEALPIDTITPDSSPGEVAIRYKASVLMLQQYIKRLELTLEQYEDTSGALDDLRDQLGLDRPTE